MSAAEPQPVVAPAPDDEARLARAEARLGVRFRDPALLRRALTHRSYVNEQAGEAIHSNERQEFLGDALLGFLVADALFRRFPDAREGDLTAQRVALIRTDTLAHWARQLGLGAVLYLSKGDSEPDELSDRVLANAFEAVLAAIYLDGGLRAARAFMTKRLVEADAIIARLASENFKGRLQELAQDPTLDFDALGIAGAEGGRRTPVYVTVARGVPATAEAFTVEARIDGRTVGVGHGANKRLAEQAAARAALATLDAARGTRSAGTDGGAPRAP